MNTELLLEHFHRLGDAPDAVPRLRRFILDLAVRGKLVEQDEQDETALQLLKRIDAAKVQAYKAGEISKPKTVPALDGNDEPYTAPSGWCWTRIRQVTADRGQTIPKKRFTYIDVTAINKEAGVVADAQVLEAADAPSRARKVVGAGDVIYSCVRPYLLNVAVIDHEIKPAPIASTAFAVMHGFGLVVPQYLWIVMRSPFMIACVEDRMRGQAYPSINDADFTLLPFPLPALPEQHRIVAKVEELMALCDRLEAAQQQREAERTRLTASAWQAVVQAEAPADVSFALEQLPALTTRPAQVKALRQTILDLAVRGRLVEQVEGDEPAEVLLGRIRKEKERLVKEGVIRKPKVLHPVTQDDLPTPHTPKGWIWTRLGVVSTLITKGSTPTSYGHEYTAVGVNFVKVEAISNGRLIPENVTSFISEKTNEFLSRSRLAAGDVLFSIAGSIGTCAIVDEAILPANTNQALAIIRGTQTVFSTAFLLKVLQSSVAHDVINKARGGAMNNISLDDIQNFIVPVPPLAEQRRIVAKVEELMALCDGLEAALAAGEALRGKVLEAVVRSETGGTKPPAPVPLRQLPVPKVRAPRYEEAEVELAVAAEPVGHTSALQAVVRRGPGRPPKNGALTSTAARSIEAYLHAHPGWHGKAAILEATGVDAAAWNAAIKALLEAGKVERQGEKKGARYRAA